MRLLYGRAEGEAGTRNVHKVNHIFGVTLYKLSKIKDNELDIEIIISL